MINLGCDSGFGYATAKHLNSLGLTVFAFCLSPSTSDLKKTCKFSDKMFVYGVDVTNNDDIQQAKEQIINFLKENRLILWSVVNNAGILGLSNNLLIKLIIN